MNNIYLFLASSFGLLVSLSVSARQSAPQNQWLARPLPQEWQNDTLPVLKAPSTDDFWQGFNDPVLVALFKQAESHNYQLSAALARIEAASQSLRKARAGYFPSLSLSAGWTKERQSGLMYSRRGSASSLDYFSLGISANWEIDIFGRISKQVESGKASLEATRAERGALNVSICASVAKTYFSLRCYQEQLEVALDHIDSQEKILSMTEARFNAGLASALDVAQARSVVLSTKATIPQLHALIQSNLNALALLCGVYQEELPADVILHGCLPNPDYVAPSGIPADLLRRRPDIVEAEWNLRALAANVGAAKKEFLPRLSISGQIGTSAHNAGDLFKGESFTWSVAPQLSWTIFDGLGRDADVAIAKADLEAAVDSYNETVMQAVFEVNDNLADYTSSIDEIKIDAEVVHQNELTLNLAVERYKLGLSDFTNVANAQLDLLESRNSLIAAKGAALSDIVSLYQSLGGGWIPQFVNR
ncbi:MAG: efflux transporter outer membrane subunit [Clostridium sp.]|nr:efflux transporter outer membrane subunit [Prevotella sp.]MCM1429652.1 efflux transporter outer membrane subunit [Clostridium sp.]MCM1474654.1 efflux transporter outer membrane subunit [Muribaculaceae bacterium]